MRRISARPSRLGTPVVLCVAVVTIAAFAVRSQGFPVQHVSLNDGGIWVTNKADGDIGRFNKPIAQIDGEVTPPAGSADLDVWQDGDIVAAYSAGKLYSVDITKPAFTDGGTAVSPAYAAGGGPAQIALNGSTLAVIGTDGTLRAAVMSEAGASVAAVASGATPLAKKLPSGSAVAVDPDIDIFVAGAGELRDYPGDPGGTGWGQAITTSVPLPATDQLSVTTVGDIPVVADEQARTIYLPDSGRSVTLPASDTSAGLTLQQSSAASDYVVAATSAALYGINLADGHLSVLSGGHSGAAAAPVQLDGCVHAAWANGEDDSYVRACGGDPPSSDDVMSFNDGIPDPSLVFRVNNDEVVLNDTANGDVFLVDSSVIRIQPQWQQFQQQDKNNNSNNSVAASQNAPLVAKPVTQGVRPGRTTVVHVLDDDSGPAGALLAVTAVSAPDTPQVSVAIAPDGQTVLATVGAGLIGDAHFEYTIDDGQGRTASAQVTLVPRSPGENGAPDLRDHYQQPTLTVASGGHLVIPVIGDWRDPDGDPLYVDDNSDPDAPDLYVSGGAGTVGVTSNGAISYAAPQAASGMTVTIHYAVSDGIAATPVPATLTVTVLGGSSVRLVSPVAEPVVVQAIAGTPVTVRPLAGDIPGADPTNPQAQLAIAGPARLVSPTSGSGAGTAVISTDVHAGTVTFTAQQPGPYFLSYEAAFGATPPSAGTIRVQVSPHPGAPKPPVTVPALAVLHGQESALVDVLANDYDPQGYVLGVVGATSADPGIHVAVVDQQWLRISADNPEPGTMDTATYTVSDGYNTATGTVSITAEAASSTDQITAQDSSITIMAGDSAAVPVLANDSSSAGLPLSLATTPPAAVPALSGLIASNQGADVRVDAPASVASEEETTVSYVATDATGATATGLLNVTIEPLPSKQDPDQAPEPENITTRETAGDVTIIQIPTYGISPDGASTAVTGITVPPSLGRIVAIGPDTISYQSYPASSGTDTFTYQVTDPYGLTGTAQVSVGILPPGPPQPPVAVDYVLNAPPGSTVHVDVLSNDIIAPGDPATVVPLGQTNKSLPAGARLDGSFVYLRAPASRSDPPAQVTYGATDGSSGPSLAQVIVHAVVGAKVPPIANDAIAKPPAPGSASVTVNVLANDDDPTGSAADLRINWAPAGVIVKGPDLVIPVKAQPREVPYEIIAPDGLTATAVVFVPGTATSAITVKPGARITLARHGSVTVPLSSVLADSYGRPLRITTTDQLSASPSGDVTVDAHQDDAFQVQAQGSYAGPGAVTVQVYDGATIQDPTGHVATLTIPVQVGPDVPVLRCPSGAALALDVEEGGAPVTYDVGLLCHVWTDTTVSLPAPRYTVSWASPAAGVTAGIANGGSSLRLAAASSARAGATGTLRVTPAGSSTGSLLSVAVVPAPLPSGQAVSVATNAGQPVTVDLAQYVTSPLPQPAISVVSVTHRAGASVTSGGSSVTITPGADYHGAFSLVALVTDVPGRTDRQIAIGITVSVIGRPGAPGTPSAQTSSHTIVVSFSPAAPNGAPVQYYDVYADGAAHQCPASPCTITGLANGHSYSLDVTATNSAAQGPPSGTASAEPNKVPDQVTGLVVTPSDTQATLTWQPAQVDGSPVTGYRAEISPAPASGALQQLGPSATSATFTGLTNGNTYTFTVEATNDLGKGPTSAPVSTVPYGKPITMPAPGAAGASVPNPATTQVITVTWGAAQDNGNAITSYTVTPYTSSSASGPWTAGTAATAPTGSTSESFTVTNNGTFYEYTVAATNAAGSSAPSPPSPPVQGAAEPDQPAAPSATDTDSSGHGLNGAIQVTFTAPAPNSAQLTSVQYGINEPGESGSWGGPFTAGQGVTQTISGLTNGNDYVVYVRGCNDASLCGSWSAASNQVSPFGQPGAPNVTANASGTQITFSWSGGGGNGRAVASYQVCIDGSCSAQSNPSGGSITNTYGNSQTHSIYAYAIDTTGWESLASGTASATTAAPPSPTVSISQGPHETTSVGDCDTSNCYAIDVSAANFTPGATLHYTCYEDGSSFWSADQTWSGALVTANGSGAASFESQCVDGDWHVGGHTISVTVTDGAKSASGSYTT
ncbi:MAG TPA: fibronectin type III domain-containing protein [Trebonia sp.]